MRTFRALFAAAILASPASGLAQPAPYTATIDRFFELLQKGEANPALDFLYASNPWISRSPDAVAQLRSRLAGLPSMVGQLQNRELLQRKTLGTRFVYLSYLAAYERQPIRFVFEFYRPQDEWITFSFSFDDTLDDDLEAAAARELTTPER